MKPMDKHYCPICGNVLAESSSVCLHCAAPIERPGADISKAGGCLSAIVLAVVLAWAVAFLFAQTLLSWLSQHESCVVGS